MREFCLAGHAKERALFVEFQISSTLELMVDFVALSQAADENVCVERARVVAQMQAGVTDSEHHARMCKDASRKKRDDAQRNKDEMRVQFAEAERKKERLELEVRRVLV